MRQLDERTRESLLKPAPTGTLDVAEGVPTTIAAALEISTPIPGYERGTYISAAQNPVINPSVKRVVRPAEGVAGKLPPAPKSVAPKSVAKATAKRAERVMGPPSDMKPRRTRIGDRLQAAIDTTLGPLFKQYQEGQQKIEETNNYKTDTEIYTPQSRKSFYRFIDDNYRDAFALASEFKTGVDENACEKLSKAATEGQIQAFQYQRFIREYIRQASPNRGVLVYHGLGSGKTCSAIAAAEALYGIAKKKIIVMTPFSLRANFMSEISFCGFKHFSLKNYWVKQIVDNNIIRSYAKSVMSLPDEYLNKLVKRAEPERRVIWIADFSKSTSNYDELTPQERDDVRLQLNTMIDSRIKFVNYNGIPATELKKFACYEDPVTGEREFDNAVIVIDEIHNLTRLMQGAIMPYMMARKGKARKIAPEPVVPGKWAPKLCDSALNYKRAYIFYRLLTNAKNSKIIGLSGTPIINFPEELGILSNILAGYIDCMELLIQTTSSTLIDKFIQMAKEEPRVDIVRSIESESGKYKVLISIFPEGYEKVIPGPEEKDKEFIGVKYNPEAQESIEEIYERIKVKAAANKVTVLSVNYKSYARLPPDDEGFRGNFIAETTFAIKNALVLKKRLTGLISYYKGSKEEYMPRVLRDVVIKCGMINKGLSR